MPSCYSPEFYALAVAALDDIYGGKGAAKVAKKAGCGTASAFGTKMIQQGKVKDLKPNKIRRKVQEYVLQECMPVGAVSTQ